MLARASEVEVDANLVACGTQGGRPAAREEAARGGLELQRADATAQRRAHLGRGLFLPLQSLYSRDGLHFAGRSVAPKCEPHWPQSYARTHSMRSHMGDAWNDESEKGEASRE